MLLAGKVAIVTGAAQGIGRACAERLAKEGAKIVLADVNANEGQRVAREIAAAGGTAQFIACDVAKETDVNAAIAVALKAHGRIDVVVNNAGVLDDAPFLDLPVAEFDRILGVNLRGAFLMGQAAARQMVKQGTPAGASQAGAIVNMSSINERFALPDHVAYSISKGGISQLTKAMAIALAPHGIRVNAGRSRHHRDAAARGRHQGQGVPGEGALAHADRAFRAAARGCRHRRLARQRGGELRHRHHHLRRRRQAAAQLCRARARVKRGQTRRV